MKVHPKVTMSNIWWEKAQDEVEAYILKGALNAIIDTGPVEAFSSPVSLSLAALNLTLGDIHFILNTHWHPDHTGGNAAIKMAADAQILIHRDEVIFLEDPGLGFDRFKAPIIQELMGRERVMQEKAATVEAGEGVKADLHLDDNDVIEIGDNIQLRVIHLPGHSPGSVGFYWEQEAVLFTGDSVPGLHVGDGKLPLIFDFPAYEKSIERLLDIPLQLLLCGHRFRGITSPASPVKRDSEIGEYLRDSLEAARRIYEAVRHVAFREKKGSLLETIDKVVARLPGKMGFKMTGDLTSPVFSASTVYWCLQQLGP